MRGRAWRVLAGTAVLAALPLVGTGGTAGGAPRCWDPDGVVGTGGSGRSRAGDGPRAVVDAGAGLEAGPLRTVVGLVAAKPCPPPTSTTSTTTSTTPPPTTTTTRPPPTTTTTKPPPITTSTTTTSTTTAPPPPATSTTTTSTTTTAAPPPPPAPPSATTTTTEPPTTTTTSTATTTTTAPPTTTTTEPPPPALVVTTTVTPAQPLPGAIATVRISVRNAGGGPAPEATLTDGVGPTATLRTATAPAGRCTVAGRTATCPLGALAPGDTASAEVSVLVDPEPAARRLSQRITLSTGGRAEAAEHAVATLVAGGPSAGQELLDLPGPTVKLVAFVGFVLAARGSGPSGRRR